MLNGNCIYSSVSLLLVGDNSLVEELRSLTSIELYLNSNYYGKHDVFQSAYLSQEEPKRSPESFFYLSLKYDTLDSNLKNKEDIVKREAILNCQNFAWSSFMSMLGLSSAIKGKIISHYPDMVMQCVDFFLIRLFFHASRIHSKKLSTDSSVDVNHWVILESLRNFRQTILRHCCNVEGVN